MCCGRAIRNAYIGNASRCGYALYLVVKELRPLPHAGSRSVHPGPIQKEWGASDFKAAASDLFTHEQVGHREASGCIHGEAVGRGAGAC